MSELIPECAKCFEEEGSYKCVRPAHMYNLSEEPKKQYEKVFNKQSILAVINDKLGLEALGDNIIVLEDQFRTGYECTKCDGSGHGEEQCPRCQGSLIESIDDTCKVCDGVGKVADLFRPVGDTHIPNMEKMKECRQCRGTGHDPDFKNSKLEPGLYPCRACIVRDLSGNSSPCGFVPCGKCKGHGTTLLVPEDSVRRPNTGKVISVGDACKRFKPGDRVLYSNHTGFDITFKRNVKFRWMREDEVPIRMHGIGALHKELK